MLSAILALSVIHSAQHAQPPMPLSTQIETLRSEHDIPAIGVAYIEDGTLVWSGVWGEQSTGVPASHDTLFNTASLMKPVAAETILRLANKGALDLDAAMSTHYVDPDIADDPRADALTLRLALSHQLGFANWRRQTDGVLSFQADPGTRPIYSGEGYDYAAHYTEALTGRGFDWLVRREVFLPASIATELGPQGYDATFAAKPHDGDGFELEPSIAETWSAADDLWIRVQDYGAIMVDIMDGEGLSEALIEQRYELGMDQAPFACQAEPFASICPDSMGFALGRFVFTYDGEAIAGHGGGDAGESAIMFYRPEREDGLVILTNAAHGVEVFPMIAEVVFTGEDAMPDKFIGFLRMQAGG